MQKNLYNPIVDFMMLGGLSVIVAFLFFIYFPGKAYFEEWFLIALIVTHVTVDPHFIHSYQLFYRNFLFKIKPGNLSNSLRFRYVFSGIILPILVTSFFIYALYHENYVAIGYTVNFMALTVIWHYATQEYGIFIVDSVMKRNFFSQKQKDILLINTYVCLFCVWVSTNSTISEDDFMGISFYTFAFPATFVFYLQLAALSTTILTLLSVILVKLKEKGVNNFPFNGCVAYLATIYIWLVLSSFNPTFFLLVPIFHSLQYIAIVWKYEYNRLKEQHSRTENIIKSSAKKRVFPFFSSNPMQSLIFFAFLGIVLGYAVHWGVPVYLDIAFSSPEESTGIFLALTWIFINIHHYFMDNVIWRKENPEIKQHLFS